MNNKNTKQIKLGQSQVGRNKLLERVKEFFQVIFRNKRATAGLIILIFFFLMSTIGPMIVKLQADTDFANALKGPSAKHWLGTDFYGKDTLSQFVHGSRNVLFVAFLTAFFTCIIAFVIGTIAGVVGGPVDAVLMFATNIILTVPSFPIMMILSMVIKISNPVSFALVLSIWSWAPLAKAIRSQILSLKNRDFVEACRVLGLSLGHIILKEMFPNMVSYIAINFIMIMKGSITASVGLIYLGLVPFQSTHWGLMLNMAVSSTGAMYGSNGLFYFLVPVFGIMLFQMGCLLFSNGIDEALNPRLRAA
jgi:peptide/nickel transport system permease protein